jgi:hypothetical protein
VLMLAVALLRARRTRTWVPVLMIVFVALMPFSSTLGGLTQVVQLFLLAVAFTGIAIAATSPQPPLGGASLVRNRPSSAGGGWTDPGPRAAPAGARTSSNRGA